MDTPPNHDITMRIAFAAKMGNRTLAQRVIEAGCLPAHQHNDLRS